MRVLMVSSSYPFSSADWRGLFIRNLVHALIEMPNVSLDLWAPPGELPEAASYAPLQEESVWLHSLMQRGGIAHILRSGGWQAPCVSLQLLLLLRRGYQRYRHADVIHVNWMQNALPLLGIKIPTIISVLGSDLALLAVPGVTEILRKVCRERCCIIAPNADWMVPELERRFGDVAKVGFIPYGVDSGWFAVSRQPTNLTHRKWIVVSRVTEKKIGPLFSWGQDIFLDGDELHLLGPLQEKLPIPEWVRYHGPVSPQELRSYWFPNATGLITLSSHSEGRPQVVLEAMAAQVPVIASSISAHKNIISHGETGWLAASKEDLSAGLAWLGDRNNNSSIGYAAHRWVREHIGTWKDCAKRYLRAYQSLLGVSN